MTIPDTCPNVDIWVDFKTHHWMDTVALRGLTRKGEDVLCMISDHCAGDGTFIIVQDMDDRDEYRVARRDFDDFIYDAFIDAGVFLNCTPTPD